MWGGRDNNEKHRDTESSSYPRFIHPSPDSDYQTALASVLLTTASCPASSLLLTLQCRHSICSEDSTGHSVFSNQLGMFSLQGLCRCSFPYPECLVPRHLQHFLLCSISLYLTQKFKGLLLTTLYKRVLCALSTPLPVLFLLYFSAQHL